MENISFSYFLDRKIPIKNTISVIALEKISQRFEWKEMSEVNIRITNTVFPRKVSALE